MDLLESTRMLTWCQFLACSFFLLLFGWHSFQGEYLIALVYFSGSLAAALLLFNERIRSKHYHLILRLSIFTVYTLLSLLLLLLTDIQEPRLCLSLYLAYPLLAFSLLPFRNALLFVLVFSVLANFLFMLQFEGTFRAAYTIVFWLVTLLTSLHSFTQHTRQERLQALLNRDPSTQLLNQQQLALDLHKEQQRAQREMTSLGIIKLTSDKKIDLPSANEIASYFATYEGLYLVAENQLVALIPLATPAELKTRELKLIKQLPKLKLTTQISELEESSNDLLAAFVNPSNGAIRQ